jgi:predicted branched-subunit amino acid permease
VTTLTGPRPGGAARAPAGGTARTAAGDLAPVLVGLAPFGLLVGVTAAATGIPAGPGTLGAALVYGGTAQLTAMTLHASGSGLAGILLAVAVVNARLLVYGAALEPMFRGQPAWFRWLGPHFVVDQTYLLAMGRRDDIGVDPRRFRSYWLWLGAVLAAAWLSCVGVGALVGPALPHWLPLGSAALAAFVGLLVPRLRDRPAAVAAATAASAAVAARHLPTGGGVLVGSLVGCLAAVWARRGRPS